MFWDGWKKSKDKQLTHVESWVADLTRVKDDIFSGLQVKLPPLTLARRSLARTAAELEVSTEQQVVAFLLQSEGVVLDGGSIGGHQPLRRSNASDRLAIMFDNGEDKIALLKEGRRLGRDGVIHITDLSLNADVQ